MPTARYYICGQVGSGTEADPYRPEIADDLAAMVTGYVTAEMPDGTTQDFPITPSWAANQDIEPGLLPTPLPRFMVHAVLTDEQHAEVAYDKKANPNGYDWFEVADDGTVTLHAA
jgi:hypothetical protein